MDLIIKQHLDEIENGVSDPNKKEDEKERDEDTIEEDDLYKDDPEFEQIANSKEDKDKAKEEEEAYDEYMEDSLNLNSKSPKQSLIDHLRLLTDIFNSSLDGATDYYDQVFDERAQFLLDFENILKIMTFDETVEYILPCMQIYSSE